jgi:hypothetical protein
VPPAACPRQPAGGTISGGHISNLTWRKASYSSSNGGNCVEIAQVPSPGVAVRDSKEPGGPVSWSPRSSGAFGEAGASHSSRAFKDEEILRVTRNSTNACYHSLHAKIILAYGTA